MILENNELAIDDHKQTMELMYIISKPIAFVCS